MNLVIRRRSVPDGPCLDLGGVAISFADLQRGGLVASGSPGSGLTSGVIVPVIERLISGYGNATERIGGLVIDAEGNLLDQIAYAMARAGRNPVEELVCLRHSSDVPLARFRDPASGCMYLVNGQPSSPAGRSEAGRLIEKGQAGVPAKERLHPEICARHERDSSAALPVLRNIKCRVAGDDVRYLGWRFADNSRASIVRKHGLGDKVARAAPKELMFEDVVRRPLGERFNPAGNASVSAEAYAGMVCDAFFPAAERGPAFAWVKAAIVAASCLCSLTGRTPSLSELCRLLVNEGMIAERLEALRGTAAPKGAERDADAVAELARFFAEWAGLDSRLRHDLVAQFTNTFGGFVTNDTLARTFCGDPTFDFASVFNAGKIVVADVSHEPAMRPIAALIEADFQRAALARSAAAAAGPGRMLLHVVPLWAQLPITGGGRAGPNDFLSEGQRTGVFNVLTVEPSDDALGRGTAPGSRPPCSGSPISRGCAPTAPPGTPSPPESTAAAGRSCLSGLTP